MLKRGSAASCGVLALASSLAAGGALAEQVALDFVLAPATPTVNTVPISVSVSVDTGFPFGTQTDSATDSSTVSGNALATLDLAFGPDGQVTTLNSLAFTGGQLRFDETLAFNLSYVFGTASVQATGSDLAGQLQTPTPPAPIAGNAIDLADHQIVINQGTLVATGSGLASGVSETVNFAIDPIVAPLSGTATVNVSLDQVIDGLGTYTASINAPFVFNQSISLDTEGVSGSVSTSANLLATATFTRPIYTPGDTDGDGDIDDTDLGTCFSNYTGPTGSGKAPAQGDTDNDGDVDDSDLGTIFSAYTGPLAPTPVPEPGSIALLAVGVTLCARRRRR
ncbi:MAG: PEP-CTERM sorting domain-containing protein [Phycisphaeraceae bacterium]